MANFESLVCFLLFSNFPQSSRRGHLPAIPPVPISDFILFQKSPNIECFIRRHATDDVVIDHDVGLGEADIEGRNRQWRPSKADQ